MKITPYLALTDELWGVFLELFCSDHKILRVQSILENNIDPVKKKYLPFACSR